MEYTRITLRIPKDLHEELIQSAEEQSKSMNAEIIERLRNKGESSDLSLPEEKLRQIIREELKSSQ